jgi:hypothetical protein
MGKKYSRHGSQCLTFNVCIQFLQILLEQIKWRCRTVFPGEIKRWDSNKGSYFSMEQKSTFGIVEGSNVTQNWQCPVYIASFLIMLETLGNFSGRTSYHEMISSLFVSFSTIPRYYIAEIISPHVDNIWWYFHVASNLVLVILDVLLLYSAFERQAAAALSLSSLFIS